MRTITNCVLGFLALLVVAASVYAVAARVRESREQTRHHLCLSNLKQIALGMPAYAQDWDGRLPDATRWQDQLYPYVQSREFYNCPKSDLRNGTAYAMAPRLSGKKVSDYADRAHVVAFYAADELRRPVARHHGHTNCAFLDGFVWWVEGVPAVR